VNQKIICAKKLILQHLFQTLYLEKNVLKENLNGILLFTLDYCYVLLRICTDSRALPFVFMSKLF
jgi:hypothetical protein